MSEFEREVVVPAPRDVAAGSVGGIAERQPLDLTRTVLRLQRTAGNRAVQALIAARAPRLKIQRWVEPDSAEAVARAIEAATADELRRMIASFDAPASSGDHTAVEGPAQTFSIATADATELRARTVEKLVQRVMEDLAAARAPIVARLPLTTAAARRATLNELHDSDAPRLAELRRITAGRQDQWKHSDPLVTDAVLAAIQLDTVYRAESRVGAPQQAHRDAANACGMDMTFDWCGFFVAENYIQSGLDRDLRAGFFHVDNVEDYFNYRYAFGATARVKKWIWADGGWHDLREYHAGRGSLRTWIDAAAIHGTGGAGLDIRSGDVVLIDHRGSARPDHIAMVDSYDPGTGALFTIGGNDSGYTVDTRPTHTAPAGESAADRAKRERIEQETGQPLAPGASGGVGFGMQDLANQPDPAAVARDPARARPRVRVFGIGRPSIVDLEDHFYDSTSPTAAPAAAPAHH